MTIVKACGVTLHSLAQSTGVDKSKSFYNTCMTNLKMNNTYTFEHIIKEKKLE